MYIDTSVLVPYYCPEPLSSVAQQTVRDDPRPSLSDLVEVELFSALARKVRVKELTVADATRIGQQFVDHLQAGFYARVAVQRRHFETARGWLSRFTLPLRALDALHLALADAEGLRLATADRNLWTSARTLGLPALFVRR